MSNEAMALLVDIARCIGCRSCMDACMEQQGFTGDVFEIDELSSHAYTIVEEHGDTFVRRLCMHCVDPTCASVCPVQAFTKTPHGAVVYDPEPCLGCRYCIMACPFDVPRYQWESTVPAVAKCDLCNGRQEGGELPACVEACPAEALTFGPRSEVLADAHRRLREAPDDYYPHVYGETEVGGTSVVYVSPVDFTTIGFRTGNLGEPLPLLTQTALRKVPGISVVGGAFLLGVWWITQRREEVARAEAYGDADDDGRLEADDVDS